MESKELVCYEVLDIRAVYITISLLHRVTNARTILFRQDILTNPKVSTSKIKEAQDGNIFVSWTRHLSHNRKFYWNVPTTIAARDALSSGTNLCVIRKQIDVFGTFFEWGRRLDDLTRLLIVSNLKKTSCWMPNDAVAFLKWKVSSSIACNNWFSCAVKDSQRISLALFKTTPQCVAGERMYGFVSRKIISYYTIATIVFLLELIVLFASLHFISPLMST